MKITNFAVSFLAATFTLTSHAQTGVDAYYEFLKDPVLLSERADDPKAAEVQALLQSLAPQIHFHSEEKFLPNLKLGRRRFPFQEGVYENIKLEMQNQLKMAKKVVSLEEELEKFHIESVQNAKV